MPVLDCAMPKPWLPVWCQIPINTFLGQLTTISFTIWVLYNWYWYLIPVIPFVVYPFAWTGHYMFEKNKPAAFHNPIKAKLADWMMFWDILRCKIKIW